MMNITWPVDSYKLLVKSCFGRLLCAVMVVVFLSPTTVTALVKFDFEQKYFMEPPRPILDHCIVPQDGVYHLFYLRGDPLAESIGHATTTDFVYWNYEPTLLEPGTWDIYLWAPHVVGSSETGWFMYYTGVNQHWAQQSGVAISADLYNWGKFPGPIYHPDPAWATWDELEWSHGRDPHIIEYNGKYYMFLTALTKDGYGAVSCAESEDFVTWTDIGPIYVHNNWHVLESVFITYRNNKFHMFFTEELVYGTSHICSDSLFSGWSIDDRYIIDDGHAPNILELDNGVEIFSRHSVYNDNYGTSFHVHRFDTLTWVGDIPAPYKPWGLAKNWNLVWGNAFAYQPVFLNNPVARGEDVADTFVGNGWLGTYERYTGPMGHGTPGGYQGDGRVGVLQSNPFTIVGKSMNLLVGGGNDIDQCYVALVDANTQAVLFKETGKDNEEMDRRYWDLTRYEGREVYIEIADLSTGTFGHINCDDITESWDIVDGGAGDDDGRGNPKTQRDQVPIWSKDNVKPVLYQNSPNPFNPNTTLSYDLPKTGRATLRIYDVGGHLIRDLVNRDQSAGTYHVTWDGRGDDGTAAVSGIYFYRLTFEGQIVETRKMLLLK